MAVQEGDALTIHVSATLAGTYVPANDLTRYSRRNTRATTSTAVFMRATPHKLTAPPDMGFTLSGLMNPVDAGQILLREAQRLDTTVFLRVLHDGVNGFTQECKVATKGHDANPDAWQETSFECTAEGDPVQVGTGPIQ